jgi:CBS domain-containing protein
MRSALAGEVMTKNPIVPHQGATVKTALDTFEGTNFRVLHVVDNCNHVLGVINLEDIGYMDVPRHLIGLSQITMHNPTVIGSQTTLEQAAQRMIENQQHHIFVADEYNGLIGVIAGIDIVKKIIELLSS